MKETALTAIHKASGARMVEYAGFLMPVEFSGVIKENLVTREAAGLFDVSHMGEFWVKGPHALDLLQYVTTNDVSVLSNGKAQYSCLPNGKGGIVDDLIIYRFDAEKYMLIVNAANIEKDWAWLNKQNTFGAILEDASSRMSLLALQGPRAFEILSPLTDRNLKELSSFGFFTATVAGIENVMVSATGYTGAGGFELCCYNEGTSAIWNSILKNGQACGVQPVGLAARDTLRLEMGYSLYGNDIDDTTSVLEAGLGWILKLYKPSDFIDKDFYLRQSQSGVEKQLIAFELIDRGIPRKDYPIVTSGDEVIGRVTSGTQSPGLQKGIGLGFIRTEFASPGTGIHIHVRNKSLRSRIVKLPFIKS
jgi:aminomethyltransferase